MVIIGSVPKPIMHGSTIVVVVRAAAAAAVIPVESPRERKRWASCVSSTKYKTDPYEIYFFSFYKKNYPWISLGSSAISRVVFDAFSLSHSSRNCLSAERGDYVFKGECREGGERERKGSYGICVDFQESWPYEISGNRAYFFTIIFHFCGRQQIPLVAPNASFFLCFIYRHGIPRGDNKDGIVFLRNEKLMKNEDNKSFSSSSCT